MGESDSLFEDGRLAQQLREDGTTWAVVAQELGCSVSTAQRLATYYLEHAARLAAQNQMVLF